MRILWAVLAAGAFWIALPGLALAGYCPDDPGLYCLDRSFSAAPLLAAGAGAAAAGAAGAAKSSSGGGPKLQSKGPPPARITRDKEGFEIQHGG